MKLFLRLLQKESGVFKYWCLKGVNSAINIIPAFYLHHV